MNTGVRYAPPERVMVLHTPLLSASTPLAARIAEQLREWQVETRIGSVEADDVDRQLADIDMLIALGGDGTMLRAGCLTAPHGVPVLGVNLGRLGFLAEVQPEEWPDALARVMACEYWLEQRMMLRAVVERDGALLST
ncbi:MAG: NAD(+)/NADH kinase, partial [Anaerolineae bacterium]